MRARWSRAPIWCCWTSRANLDYKLREELRTELPRIFEASGAIFVYATTEPSEALLLGGDTVCMWEGEVLQAGTRRRSIASPARCGWRRCSPIRRSTSSASRRRTVLVICRRHPGAASGLYAQLADGPYRVGFRAHQLEVANGIAGRHAFHATVTVTEITGSESFVHLNRDASNWVAVLQGVHEYEPGHVLDAVLDPDNVFVFDAADRLVAGAAAPCSLKERCIDARIDLVDLAHSYGGNDAPVESFALKPVTMTWRQGGAYALLGPSGCGKTTLLNLISGSSRRRAERSCSTAPTSRRCQPRSATSRRCSSSR